MEYRGSCHCGQVAFEVEGDIQEVVSCNCSLCQRKGGLLWFAPWEKFRLLGKPEAMGTYLFNTHKIQHHFCRNCGIHPFAQGVDRKGNAIAAVNVRCIEGIEPESYPVKHFDGRKL